MTEDIKLMYEVRGMHLTRGGIFNEMRATYVASNQNQVYRLAKQDKLFHFNIAYLREAEKKQK